MRTRTTISTMQGKAGGQLHRLTKTRPRHVTRPGMRRRVFSVAVSSQFPSGPVANANHGHHHTRLHRQTSPPTILLIIRHRQTPR
ncbi:uncharacterized protein BKA78DRAFT_21651 [Phyllosticta capitalensis]|uniref:uncharacterized protein n=1 Tax=Phyllosticta capitalensis TaxID=121624 RepID=UPI003131B094